MKAGVIIETSDGVGTNREWRVS